MAPSDIIETICLTFINDDTWPVFIFPDHSVPDDEIAPRPNKQALPAFILAREEFIWRDPSELLEYDPKLPYDHFQPARTNYEIQREKAFKEARDLRSMDYYHSLALRNKVKKDQDKADKEKVKQEVTIDVEDSDDGDTFVKPSKPKPSKAISLSSDSDGDLPNLLAITPLSRKRPLSSIYKRPGLPSPSPTPKHRKLSPKIPTPRTPFGEEDDDSDINLPTPRTSTPTKQPASKKKVVSNWKPSGKLPKIAPDDYVARKQLELAMVKKGDGKEKPEEAEVIMRVKDPLKVNIYVGQEEKLFIVDRAVVQNYSQVMKHIKGDRHTGFEIKDSLFEKWQPSVFESVVSWLNTADYKPRLIEGKHPHLEDIKSVGQFDEAAEAASKLWNIARKLQLTGLQELLYRKIEVQSPLSTNTLLIMTRLVFWNCADETEIDNKMRDMLKLDVAKRLHEILEEDAMLFSRVIKSEVELANYIWQYQAEHPWKEADEHLSEGDGDDDSDDED
ncbi:hypothetical protein D6D17_04054 [Aureobasidium pullulans]|uniref:BTB domain-containing protein n=1 Tax=Aureobasidium pullulans TaxID=5580 RepID=A0A4S8Y427_AURPU|nr:hypothetical protein D6D22_02176 [Aureobasidium pullulans]THX09277.1 hypothetical protein D6D17_04054 [Aureobasidium pullulans]CAC9887640.1 unnamed protein product [Aureobasidium pullulans]